MPDIYFYKYVVNLQVFFRTAHSFALVNLRPLVPGHVLVCPIRREIMRFADLTSEEAQDYMSALQTVHKFIIHAYNADSLNIAIQDGPELGQSIPHLHTHLIPRYRTDGFGDGIYRKLEKTDLEAAFDDFHNRKMAFQSGGGFVSIPDADRHDRSAEEMAAEATKLRQQIDQWQTENRGK